MKIEKFIWSQEKKLNNATSTKKENNSKLRIMKESFVQKLARILETDNPCFQWVDRLTIKINSETYKDKCPSSISNKYASFQRQLNLYNFRRIFVSGIDKPWFCYTNPLFVRNDKNLRNEFKEKFIIKVETLANEKKT